MNQKTRKILSALLLIFAFSALFSWRINLTVSDLGRHIKNGEIFLRTGNIIQTNYYSYTAPDFPAINHHWLTGIIFYLVYMMGGFVELSVFYALVSGVTVYICYIIIRKRLSVISSLSVISLGLFFIINRFEVRPEIFSYLFIVLYFYLFDRFRDKKVSFNAMLLAVFLIQLLWVNLHIFFVLGFFIICTFALGFYFDNNMKNVWRCLLLLGVGIIAGLINPAGIMGFIEPFIIFRNYNVPVLENQNIFKYSVLIYGLGEAKVYILSFLSMFMVGVLGALFVKKRKGITGDLVWPIIFLTFGGMAIFVARSLALFGYSTIVYFSMLLSYFPAFGKRLDRVFIFILPILFATSLFITPSYGFGLMPGNLGAAEFFKKEHLHGPIQNDYNIGGYLIFNLFPNEKVYFDNRPEAYPPVFAQQSSSLFNNQSVWNDADDKYNFNVIFISTGSIGPGLRRFLLDNPVSLKWKPVYCDNFAAILVKNTPDNQSVIARYYTPDLEEKLLSTHPQ